MSSLTLCFALFYLRSVAAKEPYKDRVTGAMTEPVTTGQIYWGAVPFVVIKCVMVGLVIAFPAMVMHYKSVGPQIDPSKIKIEIPMPSLPGIPGVSDELRIPLPPPIGGAGAPPPVIMPAPSPMATPQQPAPAAAPPSATPRPQAGTPATPQSIPPPPQIDLGTPRELQPGSSSEPSKPN